MIKVKSTAAKEASVSIGLDTKSAEVLKLFLEMAMQDFGIINNTIDIAERTLETEVNQKDITDIVCGIITGLDGGTQ